MISQQSNILYAKIVLKSCSKIFISKHFTSSNVLKYSELKVLKKIDVSLKKTSVYWVMFEKNYFIIRNIYISNYMNMQLFYNANLFAQSWFERKIFDRNRILKNVSIKKHFEKLIFLQICFNISRIKHFWRLDLLT